MIELVRIDDRLIHGQVVTSRVRRNSIDHILAIADEDIGNWKQLAEKVKLTAQLTPDDSCTNMKEALQKA